MSLTVFISNKYTAVRSNNLSLKYQRFTPSGSKDLKISVFEKNSIPLLNEILVS